MNQEQDDRSPAGDSPVATIRTPGGLRLELNLTEYRLALLGLVDFGADWAALQVATRLVADGDAKALVVRERLLPIASHLSALTTRGVDPLELLTARHWFRHEPAQVLP